MNFKESFDNYIKEEKEILDLICEFEVNSLLNCLIKTRDNNKKIFILGNGGSGASASHWVNDFVKGMSTEEKPFRMMCLNDNYATVSAIANDCGENNYDGFKYIYKNQLINWLDKDDLVIVISGSGNSENLIQALEYANKKEALTFAIVGYNGGKCKKLAKHNIHIQTNNMGIFEDLSMLSCHLIFDYWKQIHF